jgi:hypothetical protein
VRGIVGTGAGGGGCTTGAGVDVATTGAGLLPDAKYQMRPSTPSPASSGISHRPRCGASWITLMARGATCSTRSVVVVCLGARDMKSESNVGMLAGMTPPGVIWPISFGRRYPIAVPTMPLARPSLPAIPLIAVLPSAFSTCGAVSAAPSVRPSHEATSEPRPAARNLSTNPPNPPGEPVISRVISVVSGRVFGPSPKRPATSSIVSSNMVI